MNCIHDHVWEFGPPRKSVQNYHDMARGYQMGSAFPDQTRPLTGAPMKSPSVKRAVGFEGPRLTMPELELSLVENAFDYLLEAIDNLNSKDEKKLKYAVLHLSSAVELVFKARLVQEHWSLVFADPGKATQGKFERGDFRSADCEEVQVRLKNKCGLSFSEHQPVLKALRQLRNRVEHFAVSADRSQVESLLIKTWLFLWDFMHEELADEVWDQEDLLDDVRDGMRRHQGLVKARLVEKEGDLKALRSRGTLVLGCPLCLQDTLAIPGEDEEPSCCFCHYQRPADEVADRWATVFVGYPHSDPKEASMYPVLQECPTCGSETMIEFEDGSQFPPDPAWACFTCGESGSPTSTCSSCGEEFDYEPDEFHCPECRGEKGPSDEA
jgi:hypothetical protein